jgi:rfaE bifunctional protein nucleotidyltransferase chain/domain
VTLVDKIVALDSLSAWRRAQREAGHTVVVTNGCFDILHLGHVMYLEAARQQGDRLLVGVNSDRSVQGLKGAGRPINPQEDRATVLAALESVTAVTLFPEVTAERFLALALPDVYVKGGDYTLDTVNQDERRVVESHGGRIVFIPLVPGRSTTAMINKLGARR